MFTFVKVSVSRIKDYACKTGQLVLRAVVGDKNFGLEDHKRNIDIAFPVMHSFAEGGSETRDYVITVPAMFDKGFKNNTTQPYNLISRRVLDDLPICPECVEWFDKPNTDRYNIMLIDGRKLAICGQFTAKWWGNDKDCAGKEIWVKDNFIRSLFLIISEHAISDVLISWDTMVEQNLLKPRTSCAVGLGGYRAQQPKLVDEQARKKKKAEQEAKKAQERAVQDMKEKEKSKNAKANKSKPSKQ